ncbi:MAG: hypothetical protein HYV63_31870 [Candidatus Schekmanbacteria bacterium]|nr:hypothetical protein [Candidatus Schekmanbacteria bacterium]
MLRKAHAYLGAVTERIPILKVRALHRQLAIVHQEGRMFEEVDVKALARELQSRMSLADRIGLGEKIREWLPGVLQADEQPQSSQTTP